MSGSSFLCEGFFLVAASGGHSSSLCAGLSLSRPLLLRSTGSRRAGSVAVAHGPSCSAACGIFPDQGSNPCPLHWQAYSQPLRHQGSPTLLLLKGGCEGAMDFSLSSAHPYLMLGLRMKKVKQGVMLHIRSFLYRWFVSPEKTRVQSMLMFGFR